MCGINGIYNFTYTLDRGEEYISQMNSCIAYRGPDDSGYWTDQQKRIHFGHLRLSILDLTPEGHQPMKTPDGTVIVFNGEIFNYKELKAQYFKDKQFHSSGDTELLLYLYERFGENCVDYLNGMFAFAIWDPKNEKLFLARDRAGKKPLYYSSSQGHFAFSSELKSLLKLPWIKPRLDEAALYHFLTFNLLAPPQTMFRGIAKLEPGTKMTVSKNGEIIIKRYWQVEYRNLDNLSEAQLSDEVFNGLQKSVDYRMVSDVPVGAFLSGGVDSSAIVAMMTKLTDKKVNTFSVGFENQNDYDERYYAAKVSSMFNTSHDETIVTANDIKDFLPKIIDVFDEPLADATCIPIYFLSRKAREKGNIVVLTGDGGDELFAGYRSWRKYIQFENSFRLLSATPSFIRKGIFKSVETLKPESKLSDILSRSAKGQEVFWGGAKSFKESVKRKFLSEDYKDRLGTVDSYSVIKNYLDEFESLKNSTSRKFTYADWMCYLGFSFIIPNYYLYRMDHIGMANSIEIRTPFLDYNFVNTALSVPSQFKLVKDEPKYILKKSLERILPMDILYRKKMGFCVPLREWAGDIMINYVEQHLNHFCDAHPQFDKGELRRLLDQLKTGDENSVNRLWTLYFLISWFKRWMD